jgi:hypothetical protein
MGLRLREKVVELILAGKGIQTSLFSASLGLFRLYAVHLDFDAAVGLQACD